MDENLGIPEEIEKTDDIEDEVAVETPDPLAELERELSETRDRYLRTAAEYENYRKRSMKEREGLYADAMAIAVTAMLPVLDNLERAAGTPSTDETYKKGVEMILTQLVERFAKLGVKEIPSLGEQFDPLLHNAVMHVEDDKCDDNTVVEVFEKGFIMGERVIRHSTVKVAN